MLADTTSVLVTAATAALGWIDEIYPPDIFDGSSGDEGPVRIAEIREDLRKALQLAQPATPAMTIPAGALDAMDRCLDRLVAIFDDDANTMPDQLLDDYLISRNWIDAQDVAWIEAQKEETPHAE